MDEFLSEKEQVEQLRRWWQEYGWYLVGGMAVSAAGYFGWNEYQAREQALAENAASLYITLQAAVEDDSQDADQILEQLRTEYADSPYTDQAGLLMARDYLISDPVRATEELRRVMESSSDEELALIARLRLARVLAYREAYGEAMDILAISEPGQFEARISEIKGDIHVALGETDAAREAYEVALTGLGSQGLDRNFVQMKLNDLGAVQTSAPVQDLQPELQLEQAPLPEPESQIEPESQVEPESQIEPESQAENGQQLNEEEAE